MTDLDPKKEKTKAIILMVILVLCFFFSMFVLAEEPVSVTVKWDAVTDRENGDKLKEGELIFYVIEKLNQDYEVVETHQVAPDTLSLEILLEASECGLFQARSAATPGPACKPDVKYMTSKPSEVVSNCRYGNPPTAPMNFESKEITADLEKQAAIHSEQIRERLNGLVR